MIRQPIEQRAGEPLAAEDAGLFLERQVRRDDGRAAFVALAENLEEQLRAGLRERHIAELIDNEELDGSDLGLELEQTPLVARLHQLMDVAGRREEADGEAALTSGEAEPQTDMRLARAGITQSNYVVAGDDIFAAEEFESERLVERRDGSEIERV